MAKHRNQRPSGPPEERYGAYKNGLPLYLTIDGNVGPYAPFFRRNQRQGRVYPRMLDSVLDLHGRGLGAAMAKTRVTNLHYEFYDVYIGRRGHGHDGYFGNPIKVGGVCSECGKIHERAGTIACFKAYFLRRVENDPEFKRRVLALKGKRLGCFCAPSACHGNVIVEWIEAQP